MTTTDLPSAALAAGVPPEGEDCCAEYGGLSRRGVLRGLLGAGAGGVLGTSMFGSTFVQASYASGPAPAVLLVLSLRGACDGLSLVVPHGDPVYYQARPRIGIAKERLLATDAFFGLHPNFAPLMGLWNSGRMAVVHATGMAVPNRSHFAAMEIVEEADPGSRARVGWLNRMIGQDASLDPLQAIQVGVSTPETELCGPQPTFAMSDVDSVEVAGADRWDPTPGGRQASLRTLWGANHGAFGNGVRSALQAVNDFGRVKATAAAPANGAAYPSGSDLGKALASCARVIKADVGTEVLCVDHGGWDMHTGLGDLTWGSMLDQTSELAHAIAAFFTDLGPAASKVTLVTISEFGRRVVENADWGLDHGWGNAMMLFGAGVKGGYYGRWPGLSDTLDADLHVTTDYRSVLSEVVTKRMGASTAAVFPGFAPTPLGVVSV